METLISIIVPVYNVSAYIDKCVESIRRQTYTAWELLLVDDGSTDGSDSRCRQWAQRDPRITLLHTPHSGPAAARNAALSKARGDCLYFIDSDDWIEPDTLEFLLNTMQHADADIAVSGARFDYPERTKTVSYANLPGASLRERTTGTRVYSRDEALHHVVTGRLPSYLWLLLLRRSVVQHPLADYPCYEDLATVYKWFANARRVVITTPPKYHYVQRQGSILHTTRSDTFLLAMLQERHDYISRHSLLNDDDNRANTVRQMLKLAKDYARKTDDPHERTAFITTVRDALMPLLPVPYTSLGTKRWLRLQLLKKSVATFTRVLRL